jgi:hypothetical protein
MPKPVKTMTPRDAWLYAASWGSYIRSGDPGACMYGFDERGCVQSEKHRADVLAYVKAECRPIIVAHPRNFDRGELEKMDAFISYIEQAPVG